MGHYRKGTLKEKSQTRYHIASAVLKELVDRDLGFITILILKKFLQSY